MSTQINIQERKQTKCIHGLFFLFFSLFFCLYLLLLWLVKDILCAGSAKPNSLDQGFPILRETFFTSFFSTGGRPERYVIIMYL